MAMNEFGAGFKIYAKDFASKVFDRVGKNFSGMANKAETDAKRQQVAMQRIGRGMAMVGAGLGLLKPMKDALSESSKLNKALAEVTTLTDEATFPVKEMKGLVKGLAAEYGKDATENAKALYQTISAGFGEAEQAAKLLETANKLAIGGVTEVETAVDGLTNVMNTYSKQNLDALDVSDAFFVAVKAGKTTVGELASQIGRVAPGAEAMGIAFDEVLASIAAVTTKGIDTQQTVGGLAASLANINKPTSDAKKEAQRLGIEFNAAALRAKGLTGFLDSITKSAGFNEDSIAKLFGSIEAFKVMTAMTSNESEKYNQVLEQMGKRAGATTQAVQKMEDTFEHQASRLSQTRKNIMSTIGDTVESMVAPILKVLNWITTGISKLLDSLPPGARKAIVGIVGALGGFVTVVGGIVAVQGALGLLGISFTNILATAAKLLLLAGPLTLLFAGLGVAAYSAYRAFQKNTGGISMSWGDMVKKVKLGWQGMMAILTGDDFPRKLKRQLGKAENEGVVKFLEGFERFVERVKSFWGGLVAGFEKGVDALAGSSAMKRLKGTIDEVVGMFTGKGQENTPTILEKWEKEGESTGKRLARLGEIALNAIADLVSFGKKFADFVGNFSADDLSKTINGAVTAFNELWSVLKEIGAALQMIFRIVSTVINAIQLVGGFLGDVFGGAASNISMANEYLDALASGDEKRKKQAAAQYVEFIKNFKPFEASQEQLGDFARIWGSNTQWGMPGQDQQQRGVVAQPKKPVAQADRIVWDQGEDSIEDLRAARASLLDWMNTSTEEWRKTHPDKYSYQEATGEQQKMWLGELDRVERLIKAALERPQVFQVDGEVFARSYTASDEAQGTRSYEDAGAMGY